MTENGYGVSFWSDGNVPKLNCGDGCTIFLNLLRLGLLPKHVFPGEHTSVILSSTILSPREGDGTPLQYSCLENPTDGGAWWLQSMGSLRVRHDFHALEKEMATPSSVLAWRVPGMG